ncbi:excisionase family DNA-binding protein [Pengzhenrongella sp.]|jgi:excisionase family DNA binding protein|uniref:excisionase family DNA-binding protein n=1 Tax=Pengzhenrongella sp. TaxID=2888820 RepID=UPI002F93468F
MTEVPLTINPEDVRRSAPTVGAPGWLQQLAEYVREAAASGQTVTVTSRRRMLTPEQVAEALGVSRSTISRKIKAGQIRAVKVGNRNRIPYEEFERYWDQVMTDMVTVVADDIEADLFGDE